MASNVGSETVSRTDKICVRLSTTVIPHNGTEIGDGSEVAPKVGEEVGDPVCRGVGESVTGTDASVGEEVGDPVCSGVGESVAGTDASVGEEVGESVPSVTGGSVATAGVGGALVLNCSSRPQKEASS